MILEVLAGAASAQVSDALSELSREIARNLVLIRGSMGSAGSGVIWDRPGLVITNHHVVPGPIAEVSVLGGRRLRARVVRRAPTLDLAALEIVEGELPVGALSKVGDSDQLRVGDLVVAVGNPMGERNAPSLGILASAPDDVLRLSITLRPGNSGGALVNAAAEVVGIPNMVTGSGLALAVSSRIVQRFLSSNLPDHLERSDGLRWV